MRPTTTSRVVAPSQPCVAGRGACVGKGVLARPTHALPPTKQPCFNAELQGPQVSTRAANTVLTRYLHTVIFCSSKNVPRLDATLPRLVTSFHALTLDFMQECGERRPVGTYKV